jgi:hypothetical protein
VPLRLVIDPALPPRCVFFARSHCEQDSARRTASQPPVPEDARWTDERQAVEFAGAGEDGDPEWDRPGDIRVAPDAFLINRREKTVIVFDWPD